MAIYAWRPAAWLRVSGEDAATFLQGQFTNDLRALGGVGAVYGLWLNVKGKVVADSFVLRGAAANEFWLGSYFSPAATIRERLESHVIADDVSIEDATTEWAGISLLGPDAGTAVTESSGESAFVFRGRRERDGGVEYVYRVGGGPPPWLANRIEPPLEVSAVERRRIAAGIPAIPIDIGPGDLPNEAGLEADAISYVKGCYLGQEVMARLKSMGQVRRRLLRVHGSGAAPSKLPAALYVGVRRAGELRSTAPDDADHWLGLAMLSRLHVKHDTRLAFAPDAVPAVQIRDAP